MSGRNDTIEPVDADKLICCATTKRWTSCARRLDLRVSQTRRHAEATREQRCTDRRCRDTRIAEEASRIGERLDHALISSAERGHRTHCRQAELIVEHTEVTANNGLRRGHPGETNSRREVSLG